MTQHTDTFVGEGARRRRERRSRTALAARAAAMLSAGLFLLHGLAHLVGLVDMWGLSGEAVTNTSSLLAGLEAASPAYAALGVAWAAALVLFFVSAAGLVLRRIWWLPTAFTAAGLSLALCVLWYETAGVGLVVNTAILAGLLVWWTAGRARAGR
jgi:hypothetical protein